MSYITRVLSTMSRFGMRSLSRPFFHFLWFNLRAFRLASPPGGMRLPPEGEPCSLYDQQIKNGFCRVPVFTGSRGVPLRIHRIRVPGTLVFS